MRTTLPEQLEAGRITTGYFGSAREDGAYGAFCVRGPCGRLLTIIASAGEDLPEPWQHVSVSLKNRPPNWQEMCFVKDLFWHVDECVIQFHPPESAYVNNHPHCLHLWKPPYAVPLPPELLIGVKNAGAIKSLAQMRNAMRKAGLL